jgi:hypothetical protein
MKIRKIWRRYKRALRQSFKLLGGRTRERLARFTAWRMHDVEHPVYKIECEGEGWTVWIRDIEGSIFIIYTTRLPDVQDGKLRLKYHPKPSRSLIGHNNRHDYKSNPAAYLSLA